ncbi:amidohydrolase [Sediminitomix flava]|uniref:Omega-amidase YafV n=1 Tax=Sediminitomix flava TaxID=379075 RepID=A0A315ZGP1_SEDFL|nr:amidohydrolase [Sediminitomix flava]PWJ44512.1 putative amidohydrolase [Sediminitomix flava]
MLKEQLKVALVQTNLYDLKIGANLAMLEELFWEIEDDTDLILLPEMFTTGFHQEAAQLAEPMNLTTSKWMLQMAKLKNAVIMGSFPVKEKEGVFNRLLVMNPDGSYKYYDKRHLFRMADEDKTFSEGKEKLIVEVEGWKICPLICYDLRFPVWSRNCGNEYDILVYLANWPAPRVEAWDTLLKARAIENLSYCIGVNRTGQDMNMVAYNGHSVVVSPKGNALNELYDKEQIISVSLHRKDLDGLREKFPAHLDADKFTIL